MRLKIVIPQSKDENLIYNYEYFINDPWGQIERKMTFDEYKWLYDKGVWDRMEELTSCDWIDYGEADTIIERSEIEKVKEMLIAFNKEILGDEIHNKLVNEIIYLFEKALEMDTAVIIIL